MPYMLLAGVSRIDVFAPEDEKDPVNERCGMYTNWYAPEVYNGILLFLSLFGFWLERSAEEFLPLLSDSVCAYVRIQLETDHAQPPWWFNRHANVALNAAWDGGANPHVYYADYALGGGTQSPTQLTAALEETIDPAIFDPDDRASWPNWPDQGWFRFYQLDVLRWAYQAQFRWSEAADTEFEETWEAYV